MNQKNRKNIEKLIEKLDEVKTDLEFMQEDEESKYNNMPEGIQDSERGEEFQAAIENLESAASSIEEAIDYLNEILEG